MKKVLFVALALSLALSAKAFAGNIPTPTTDAAKNAVKTEAAKTEPAKTVEATKTDVKNTTNTATTEPAKTATTVATTKPMSTMLKGNITKLETSKLSIKDNTGKEWAFNAGTISLKDYKVGDKVEVNYEKDNLKSIAKAK
jgi:hypothetical protein